MHLQDYFFALKRNQAFSSVERNVLDMRKKRNMLIPVLLICYFKVNISNMFYFVLKVRTVRNKTKSRVILFDLEPVVVINVLNEFNMF